MPYTLIDAETMHRKHPDTFDLVSPEQIMSVKPGSYVKIGVKFKPHEETNVDGERFWVRVAQMGDPMRGVINNDLVYTSEHGLECDAEIKFELRHILDVFAD